MRYTTGMCLKREKGAPGSWYSFSCASATTIPEFGLDAAMRCPRGKSIMLIEKQRRREREKRESKTQRLRQHTEEGLDGL